MTDKCAAWRMRLLCVGLCLGAFWSASGLVQLHEVFSRSSAEERAPSASASSLAAAIPAMSDMPTIAPMPPAYDRLVIVLVDALRADMLLGDRALGKAKQHDDTQELSLHMPLTRALLARDLGIAYVAHASVPTVTMPRLKALLSGKPPAFIDILKNFNSAELADDNLVHAFHARGDRLVLYGDDTWLKLFPTAFQRHDVTSGFFTRDTVGVDHNVTRHLHEELDPQWEHRKSRDWEVLVLHYLGLDHVGHLRGPRSTMMNDKLHEMDAIVHQVHAAVLEQDEKRRQANPQAKPSLILVCSDHGMTEGGNHGGATVEESSALLVFLRGEPWQTTLRDLDKRRLQVDLVPTVATLFGLDIPRFSTGLILEEVVTASRNDVFQYLRALDANYHQLWKLVSLKLSRTAAHKWRQDHLDLQNRVQGTSQMNAASEILETAQQLANACQQLQNVLAQSDGSEYNIALIARGVFVLIAVMIAAAYWMRDRTASARQFWNEITFAAVVGSMIQIISLSSSSSIENEHATAFFTITSLLLVILMADLRHKNLNRKMLGLLILVLVSNRVLRSRNQVINFGRLNGLYFDSKVEGYEFANDDSISILSTGVLFSGIPTQLHYIVIFACVAWKAIDRGSNCCNRTLSRWLQLAMIGWFAFGMAANGACTYLASVEASSGVKAAINADNAARVVYAVVVAFLCAAAFVSNLHRSTALEMALFLIIVLVQPERNVPTLSILMVQSCLLSPLFRQLLSVSHWSQSIVVTLITIWLAFAAFFALGNSHLITTVDISQSYHGLSEYSQGIVGCFTFINIFSGPIVVFSTYFDAMRALSLGRATTATLILYYSFRMMFYTIIVFFMRFHLFIWSVFAPKMLYEVAFTIAGAVIALIVTWE